MQTVTNCVGYVIILLWVCSLSNFSTTHASLSEFADDVCFVNASCFIQITLVLHWMQAFRGTFHYVYLGFSRMDISFSFRLCTFLFKNKLFKHSSTQSSSFVILSGAKSESYYFLHLIMWNFVLHTLPCWSRASCTCKEKQFNLISIGNSVREKKKFKIKLLKHISTSHLISLF